MTSNLRFILSSTIALGLALFVVASACVTGVASSSTLLGFGLLVGYGMLEIAVVSYQMPHLSAPRRVMSSSIQTPAVAGNVVTFRERAREEYARAA